ncbi:MAG: hypothetical protein CVU41_10505 [Chloroflexi bacterium HGW-Chloroflexi-3]|nr:MAG: hypothetical protein CVU41_10505 [Chloroflexi bacterium HGW-Chloroflexi-3]
MSEAGVQACKKIDIKGGIHLLQLNIVNSLDVRRNRYTNGGVHFYHIDHIKLINLRCLQRTSTPWNERF